MMSACTSSEIIYPDSCITSFTYEVNSDRLIYGIHRDAADDEVPTMFGTNWKKKNIILNENWISPRIRVDCGGKPTNINVKIYHNDVIIVDSSVHLVGYEDVTFRTMIMMQEDCFD